jgi:hypothetical protein
MKQIRFFLSVTLLIVMIEGVSAQVGPNSPGTTVNVDVGNDHDWKTTVEVVTSNNSYSIKDGVDDMVDMGETMNYLKATNFNFILNDGCTILGIEVSVERGDKDDESIRDYVVQLVKGGVVVGSNYANLGTDWGTEKTITYGRLGDLWGAIWTEAEIEAADFGMVISAIGGASNGSKPQIDHITITVHTTGGTPATFYARKGGARTHWSSAGSWSYDPVLLTNCFCQPGAGDTVIIDGFEVNLDNSADVTIGRLELTNTSGNGKLEVKDGSKLTVTGEVVVQAKNTNKDVALKVNGASFIQIDGDLTMSLDADHTQNNSIKLMVENTATLTVDGEATLAVSNNNSTDKKYIELKDDGVFTCGNNFVATQAAGNDVILSIEDNAVWNVANDFTLIQTGGDQFEISLNSWATGTSAKLNVGGNFLIDKDGGGDVEILLDQTSSEITIGGNLTFDNSEIGAGDFIHLLMKNGSDLDVEGDIVLTAAAETNTYIEVNDDSKIEIAGNFNRSNNFGRVAFNNASIVEYDGSLVQVVAQDDAGGGTDRLVYQNVIINNTFGTIPQLTTEGVSTINGEITFTDGVLATSATNILVVNDGGSSTGGSINSYVDGPMKKVGNAAFTFPLGDGAAWARAAISNPIQATDAFTAQYFASPFGDASVTGALNNVSILEYWTIERGITSTADVTVQLHFESATNSAIDAFTSDLVVARYDGTDWETNGQSAITASDPGDVTSNVVSSFSSFTFGSLDGSANPLPIELIRFEANLNEDQVELNWATASEINNDYFTVKRSVDGINWQEILSTKGAGNSNQVLEYFETDDAPLGGTSYYRLIQTDFDGDYSYSDIVSVKNKEINYLRLFPNPVNQEGIIHLEFNTDLEEEVLVVLKNMQEKEFYATTVNSIENGMLIAVPIDVTIPGGLYLVITTSKNQVYSQKLIVQ